MQQAARVSDMTAFMTTDVDDDGTPVGRLVEYDVDREDLHEPVRSRDRGLHHRSVRVMADTASGAGVHVTAFLVVGAIVGWCIAFVLLFRTHREPPRAARGTARAADVPDGTALDDGSRTGETGCG